MEFKIIIDYISLNYIEILGVVLSVLYMFFSIQEKPILWIFCLLAAVCYLIVFFQNRFYAIASLQFYYMAVSIYGFYNWIQKREGVKLLSVKHITSKQLLFVPATTITIFVLLFFVIKTYTQSPIPLGDSVVAALCITATFLAAKKVIESWLLFVIADVICIGLFTYQRLYPTVALFVFYAVMSVLGYIKWNKSFAINRTKPQYNGIL